MGHSEFPPLLTLCAAYVGLAAILVPVSWGPWVCLAIMAPGVLGALYLGACYVWWHWRRPPG